LIPSIAKNKTRFKKKKKKKNPWECAVRDQDFLCVHLVYGRNLRLSSLLTQFKVAPPGGRVQRGGATLWELKERAFQGEFRGCSQPPSLGPTTQRSRLIFLTFACI
jgi:hypothetical protein